LPPDAVNVKPEIRVPSVELELTTMADVLVMVDVPPLPPMIERPLLLGTVNVHEALPAPTLIVSPLDALAIQAATLVWSMVDVHVGLEPVQAPKRDADANAQIVKSFNKMRAPRDRTYGSNSASIAADFLLISMRYTRASAHKSREILGGCCFVRTTDISSEESEKALQGLL
jgi:hypothetical protein